jgi:hypothetical protein
VKKPRWRENVPENPPHGNFPAVPDAAASMPFGAKIPESFRREAEKKNSLLLHPLLI